MSSLPFYFTNIRTLFVCCILLFSASLFAEPKHIEESEHEVEKPIEELSKVVNEFQNALAAAEGKVVYIDFWASWCGPCRESFPAMNKWQEKFSDGNFKIITINLDADKDNALDFLVDNPANFDIIYDPEGELAQIFQVRAMPSSYLLNENRELLNKHTGFDTFTGLRIENEIEKLFLKKTQ